MVHIFLYAMIKNVQIHANKIVSFFTDHDYHPISKLLPSFAFLIRTLHYFDMCPVCDDTET
jgi:hypothetical protein